MRERELQGTANTLCQMFCGWQMVFTMRNLAALGSGTLEIDLLSCEHRFDHRSIEALPISSVLQRSLRRNSTADALQKAQITATLKFSRVSSENRDPTSPDFYKSGVLVGTKEMHRCEIHCQCELITRNHTYSGSHQETREWPVGWP